MGYRIVTISSQIGSGDREIAQLVSANLGIPCYEEDLMGMIARESGFDVEFVKEHAEDAPGGWLGFTERRDYYGNSLRDTLYKAQEKVICGLAQAAPCVIVGCGADYFLRNNYETLSVFIHAPTEERVERIIHERKCSEKDAMRQVKNQDKARTMYYQVYTDQIWGAVQNYHLCLDSGRLHTERCARIIEMVYRD